MFRNNSLIKIGPKYRPVYINIGQFTQMHMLSYTVAGDIKSPQKRSLRLEWYRAVRIAEEVQTLSECAAILRYTYIVSLVPNISIRFPRF
jgi:hypothetical protein